MIPLCVHQCPSSKWSPIFCLGYHRSSIKYSFGISGIKILIHLWCHCFASIPVFSYNPLQVFQFFHNMHEGVLMLSIPLSLLLFSLLWLFMAFWLTKFLLKWLLRCPCNMFIRSSDIQILFAFSIRAKLQLWPFSEIHVERKLSLSWFILWKSTFCSFM